MILLGTLGNSVEPTSELFPPESRGNQGLYPPALISHWWWGCAGEVGGTDSAALESSLHGNGDCHGVVAHAPGVSVALLLSLPLSPPLLPFFSFSKWPTHQSAMPLPPKSFSDLQTSMAFLVSQKMTAQLLQNPLVPAFRFLPSLSWEVKGWVGPWVVWW